LVGLLLLLSPGLVGLAQEEQFETYTNDNLGFTIDYPSGWDLHEVDWGEDIKDEHIKTPWDPIYDVDISSPEVTKEGIRQASLSVSIFELKEEEFLDPNDMTIKSRITPNFTSRDLVEGWKTSNLWGNERIIRENETAFGTGKYPGSGLDVMKRGNFYSSIIYSVYEGKIYGIRTDMAELAVPEYLPTIQKMIDSFHITEAREDL
jgi:hypothetical protein